MNLGWFANLTEANNHFNQNRPFKVWDDITDDSAKEAVLRYGYDRIYHSPQWDVPTYAAASAEQLVVLRIINAEMAEYLITHLADEGRRKGLQAQNVIHAGIVKEIYDKDHLDKLPIPANVLDLLKPFKTGIPFYATDIDRDEEESVTEDVTDL